MPRNPIQSDTDVSWFRDLVVIRERIDALDDRIREALNAAYAQGVRDATEHRTGVDPVHGPHDG
jgi:hypothetical protein